MTDEQILRKAIEKATKNSNIVFLCPRFHYRDLIFKHEFAKAFWGKGHTGGIPCKACGYNGCYELWHFHLQQMVLEPEPLKYLSKFLGVGK